MAIDSIVAVDTQYHYLGISELGKLVQCNILCNTKANKLIVPIEKKDLKKFEWDTELGSVWNHSKISDILWDIRKDDEQLRKKPLYQDSEFRHKPQDPTCSQTNYYEIDDFDYNQAVCGPSVYSCVGGNCGGKGKIVDSHGYTIFCSNPNCSKEEVSKHE